MTFCFIQAIERGHAATYGSILNAMRSAIRNAGNGSGGGAVTSLISMLLTGGSVGGGFRQVWVLIMLALLSSWVIWLTNSC